MEVKNGHQAARTFRFALAGNYGLAYIVTVGFFLTLWYMIAYDGKSIDLMIGGLTTAFGLVLNSHFARSSGGNRAEDGKPPGV